MIRNVLCKNLNKEAFYDSLYQERIQVYWKLTKMLKYEMFLNSNQNYMSTYSVVTTAYHDSLSGALHSVGREECQVLGLKRVLIGKISTAGLRFRLASQTGVVHFETTRFNNTYVSRDTVAEFNLYRVHEKM